MATSDVAIKTAKPQDKDYKMRVGEGLYLLVRKTGRKIWRLDYRINGKQKTYTFGRYPEIGLKQAKLFRDEARASISLGIDPMLEKMESKSKKVEVIKVLTFGEVAERWYLGNTELAAKPWAPSTTKKARLYLDKDILPTLGHRPIAEITRAELIAFNDTIEERGAFDIAKKIREWLNTIFDEAYDREEINSNPAMRLRPSARAKGVTNEHHPTVSFLQLPDLLAAVDATNSSIMNKLAIRVMLLTAVRPGELRLAKWDEFDLENGIWSIPAERMKMREPHEIPLSKQAATVLKLLNNIVNGSEYVLPNTKGEPISDATINKTFRLAGYDGKEKPRQTGHGFRHLLSTELNERGYNSDWIEAQLAHKVKGDNKIRGVYNHAIYYEQRAVMMQEWADLIETSFPYLSAPQAILEKMI